MIKKILLTVIPLLLTLFLFGQEITQPLQPEKGPGGADYSHEKVDFQDHAAAADGYWLFEPLDPKPDSAHVVVFLHGYGAYNPMIYGSWIKHLVRKGNIVIFPRYQEHLLSPLPNVFADYCSKAIRNALKELTMGDHVRPITDHMALVGHSFGGAIAADLGINYEKQGIPKPEVLMLCSPGTGFVKMGQLPTYENMPEDTKLLVTVSEDDYVVGDELGLRVFNEAKTTKQKNFIRQRKDTRGEPSLSAHHNESYSLLEEFDSGHRSSSVFRAFRVSKLDVMDYNGYWKWFDALLDCSRNGENCHYALGDTEEQKNLGLWSDGEAIKGIEVTLGEVGDW